MKYERYPKRPKESNFIAPKEVFWLNITPSEKMVYLYLLSLEVELSIYVQSENTLNFQYHIFRFSKPEQI